MRMAGSNPGPFDPGHKPLSSTDERGGGVLGAVVGAAAGYKAGGAVGAVAGAAAGWKVGEAVHDPQVSR